jgi:hypothetical protein
MLLLSSKLKQRGVAPFGGHPMVALALDREE